VLGVREVAFLDYSDGDLDQAAPAEAIGRIVGHLRRVRPRVVVTFSPDGHYGHPDHIAISQLTQAAAVMAADASYADPDHQAAHRVAKLYYLVDSLALVAQFQALAGGISMTVDGVERRHVGWQEWAITTRIDATDHWRTAWQAIRCHESQLPSLEPLDGLADDTLRHLFGHGTFYRAYSLVNGGRQVEHDLFAGLR
jgi:LmbE family N-acetylglucosaminyl deacetylase